MRGDEPGGERLPLPERRRPLEQARRHEREDLADLARGRRASSCASGAGCRTGTARSRAPSAAAAWTRAGRARTCGPRRRSGRRTRSRSRSADPRAAPADVVRLVDHDQHRPALVAPPPQLAEHGRGDERLLLPRRERAEVDHEAARVVRCEPGRIELRSAPAQMPQRCTPRFRARPIRSPAGLALALELLSRSRVTGSPLSASATSSAYSSRSATGSRRSMPPAWPARAPLKQRARAPHRPAHGQRAGRLARSAPLRLVRVRTQLTEPHEVGVRVEHDELQVGLEQQLLEHDAEGVRLAGARLAAEKRVPAEATGVERERHARREQQLPDLQPGSPRCRLLEVVAHLVGRRRPHRGVVERRAVPAQHTAFALGAADHDLRRCTPRRRRLKRARAPGAGPPRGSRPVLAGLGALLEHDVRAGLQLQTVQ